MRLRPVASLQYDQIRDRARPTFESFVVESANVSVRFGSVRFAAVMSLGLSLVGCNEEPLVAREVQGLELPVVLDVGMGESNAHESTSPVGLGSSAPQAVAAIATNCSEDPRHVSDQGVAASLGNGLVYDARVVPLRRDGDPPGATDPTIEDLITEMREIGFRPAQIDIKPHIDGSGNIGWDYPEWTPTFISDEDANHVFEVVLDLTWSEFVGYRDVKDVEGGWRPISITQTTDHPADATLDSQRYSAIWVRDGAELDWELAANLNEVQLEQFLDAFGAVGYRPISLEASRIWNGIEHETRYAVVTVADELGSASGNWDISVGLEMSDVEDDIDDKSGEGFVPFYVSTEYVYGSGSPQIWVLDEVRFNVLYVREPSGDGLDVIVEHGISEGGVGLPTINDQRRAQGYHLVSVARFHVPGTLRSHVTAIWHRYPENKWPFRTQSDQTPWAEENLLPVMSDAFVSLMTQRRIPAAQLAVMRGDELVLSWASTYAPVAYDPITTATPIMAASITKPLTAVATVNTFGVSGLADDLMDLVPAPTMGSKPQGISVQQVLQHTGGWNIGTTALAVKDEVGEGRLATSQDWLDHMAQLPGNGIVNPPGMTFLYSNFGYEMLALALKVEAGIDGHDELNQYESDLMKPLIFDEVGMCRTAYKRQGLLDVEIDGMPERFAEPEYGPCIDTSFCTDRFYLNDPDHPYAGQSPPLTELSNPPGFDESALSDDVPAPKYLRSSTYGGGGAIHSSIGAGALVSTAEDLARFMVSFRPFFLQGTSTPLLTQAQAQAVFPPSGAWPPTNCDDVPGRVQTSPGFPALLRCYGLGFFVGNDPQGTQDAWSHGGDSEGAMGAVLYHPETDTTVAVLFARHSNSSPWYIDQILDVALDAVASSGLLPPEPPEFDFDSDDGELPPGYGFP